MRLGLRMFRLCPLGSTVAVVCTLAAGEARASLLVYEGFRASTQSGDGGYPTAQFWANNTFAPNQYTVGLNQAVNYALNNDTSWQVSPDGLSFSSAFLPTLAGSLQAPNGGTVIAGAQLSLPGGAFAGTLYHSHLARFAGHSSTSSNGLQVRVTDAGALSTNERFRAESDTRGGGTSQTAGVSYNSGTSTTGGAVLLTDTTYLIIARYSNVGGTLSAGTPGVGTLYALTAAQYDSFVAAGATESYLDTTAIGTGAGAISSRLATAAVVSGANNAFTDSTFVQWVNQTPTTSPFLTAMDEMRYGSTLADVAGVPEPAGLGLASVATLGLLRRRRRL